MNRNDWQFIDTWSKKIRAINFLGSVCDCGNKNIFHLCFHHIDNDKEYNINTVKSYRWSKIKNELKKCKLMCNNCHQEHHFKENVNDTSLRLNKIVYLEYKGLECIKCGYNKNISSLSFHHIQNKEININKYRKRFKNVMELDNFIKSELDNCELLCQNCHVESHIDEERFNKLKNQIYYKVDNFKEINRKIPENIVKGMYEDGVKQKDIAAHFNTSKGTISGIIKKLGINNEYKVNIDNVKELYDKNIKPSEIAKILNINKNTIYGVIRKIKKDYEK